MRDEIRGAQISVTKYVSTCFYVKKSHVMWSFCVFCTPTQKLSGELSGKFDFYWIVEMFQ